MSEQPAAVSGSEAVRRQLEATAEAVGLRALVVTNPGPGGEIVSCSSTSALAAIREGERLRPGLPGLDEHSLPIIDPSGGHVSGALRWVRGAARSPLESDELEVIGACAEAVAGALLLPAGSDPPAVPEHPEGREANVMRLLAAAATRSVKSAWEIDRVVQLTEATARELALDDAQVGAVVHLAMLKDIGGLGIPPRVLNKRGLLDRSEARLLREQPVLGERIVAAMPDLAYLAPLIRAGREEFDGTGYPDGLRGGAIPLPCRIVKVCDAHVAMLADRPYRKALPLAAVAEILSENAGTQFCPASVAALERVLLAEDTVPAAGAARTPAALSTRPVAEAKGPAAEAGGEEAKRERVPERPPAARGHRARVTLARGRTPERAARVLYPVGLIVGVALGVIIALPIDSAEGRCPPPGAVDRTNCLLQKVWLHELTVVFVVALATMLAGYIAFFKLPDMVRRWRSGELFSDRVPPPVFDDPVLLAASWGQAPRSKGQAAGAPSGSGRKNE